MLSSHSLTAKVVKVKSIKYVDSPDTVCDLTIQDNHNLFVCDEITKKPILCHNCHDENMKFLQAVTGEYFYSLGNISTQHGFEGYLTAAFGKGDRKNIATHDLDEALVRYCLSGSNLVSTSTGPVPIADLAIGDIVLSYDHEKECTAWKPVTGVSHHTTKERMFDVDFGEGVVRLTESHEVWSVTRGSYVKVKDLTCDEEVLTVNPSHYLTA